jgi:general secretion pathway protein D
VGLALICALLGCSALDGKPDAKLTGDTGQNGIANFLRGVDLSPRFPTTVDGRPAATNDSPKTESAPPLIFPGSVEEPEPPRNRDSEIRVASAQPIAFTSDGVEMNFDGADVQTVAKTLLGDVLKLNFVVDPRVQGSVTLATVGPIPRKEVLPAFESILRMSNAAIVHEGSLVKIVPLPEGGGNPPVSVAGQPGFGISVVPLRYTSAVTVAKTAEGFLSRPGAIRVVPSRNLLLVQGTTAEREAALNVISTFDVEWLRNQSVGVYPLKATSPETMITELERVFETKEGGVGQGVVRFQPISRMNAVMVVTKNPKLLAETTQWVQRLDRADRTGTTMRTYRLKYGNPTRIAKVLNDLFVSRTGSSPDQPAKEVAPGSQQARSRLDSLDRGGSNATRPGNTTQVASANGGGGALMAAFADPQNSDDDAASAPAGSLPRGAFQNVRLTADTANKSIVVYSNQEDYRVIEAAIRDFDRPRLQVAIEATVAEVTLTDDLQFGVQYFLTSKDLGLGKNNGSVSLLTAAQTTAQSALLSSGLLSNMTPAAGLNVLLGSDSLPRVIINALSTITDVKVLSSPSVMALDDQPALLQVGDEIPVTTSTATLLTSATTPVVNTVEMRNTGVILKVLPHVNSNGTIQLEIDQEISNLVNPNQQTLTPTISQRRVHSTVALTSGQTVLLAGLISERDQRGRSGIPGLESTFLAPLFGNVSGTKQRSEIIIFIKSRLVRNSVDASAVTEEFREKLQLMRGAGPVVVSPAPVAVK